MTSGAAEHVPQSVPEADALPPPNAPPVAVPDGRSAGVAPGQSSALEAVLSRAPATDAHVDRLFVEKLLQAAPRQALDTLLKAFRLQGAADWQRQIAELLNREIAALDVLLTDQVNAILHHPRFQQLEASWRGLKYLVDQAAESQELSDVSGGEAKIEIRVLSATKREIFRDLDGAGEFDQSEVFRKIYDNEFGMPGGTPYGVVLGDYQFTNHVEDVELLRLLSEVAAAAFAPFVASAAPGLLGLGSMAELQMPLNLGSTFQQLEYVKWRALRDMEDARFLGLLLPRTLMRVPYENDGSQAFGFRFAEDTSGRDYDRYLWGSSIYSFGSVLTRAFAASGWFADIRGAERGTVAGGMVTGLPAHSFTTDARGVAIKASTEVMVSDEHEPELGALGFISLCHCQDTPHAAYFSNQSVHRPKTYDTLEATTNAKISAMLQYMLCASRFAHYLKVYVRDKVGGYRSAAEVESELGRWLSNYVTADELASSDIKARYPLRQGNVEVREVPGRPGTFRMVMHLLPHFQLDQLTVALKMVTRLSPVTS